MQPIVPKPGCGRLSLRPSIRPSICLSVCSSVCPSIRLPDTGKGKGKWRQAYSKYAKGAGKLHRQPTAAFVRHSVLENNTTQTMPHEGTDEALACEDVDVLVGLFLPFLCLTLPDSPGRGDGRGGGLPAVLDFDIFGVFWCQKIFPLYLSFSSFSKFHAGHT